MKIACIGTGFVGVVTAGVFARLGHEVVGLDVDETKVKSLSKGTVPFFEPGLEELLKETLESGNLTFTTDYQEAITGAQVVMIMVGTPSAPDGQADLKYVINSASALAPHLSSGAIIVLKSTVPPGTNDQVRSIIQPLTKVEFDLASIPEFLKEGSAVEDTLHPDRVIIGATNPTTIAVLTSLHRSLTENIIVMNPASAQMAKYAANVYLAMRITFANQIADLCELNGADIEEVLRGIGADRRIGTHYWYPGLGYGGSCFPKDVKEIAAYARSVGELESIFIAVDDRNEKRIPRLMEKFAHQIDGFAGKKVAVLGLSFKPNTNDMREAPSLKVIPWLLSHGASVVATDPQAIDVAKPLLPTEVEYQKDFLHALEGADILMLLVEWEEYKNLDLPLLKKKMNQDCVIIDTRNQFAPAAVKEAGIKYISIGR